MLGRHRVIPAGRPWVAPSHPAGGVPAATDAAVNGDRLEGVRRTRGVVPADLAVERADQEPVQPEQADQQVLHARHPGPRPISRVSAASKSAVRAGNAAVAEGGRARTTSTAEPGNDESRSRARCRRRRFTRFRVTAGPTALLTTNPIWAGASTATAAGSTRWSTRVAVPARRPRRTVCANSRLDVSRLVRVSTCRPREMNREETKGSTERKDARSGCQTAATLATARRQDGATGAGAHPQAETVRLVTATVVRLERTLAHECVLPVSGCMTRLFSDRVFKAFGHEASVDTGSTDQRYALRRARVKPTTPVGTPIAVKQRRIDHSRTRWSNRSVATPG